MRFMGWMKTLVNKTAHALSTWKKNNTLQLTITVREYEPNINKQ